MRSAPKQAAAGMGDFMQKLTEAVEEQQRGQKDPEAEWDEHDYEKVHEGMRRAHGQIHGVAGKIWRFTRSRGENRKGNGMGCAS